MSVDNFKPTIWSRELLFSLKESMVSESLINRNYQGDISSEGDTVKVQTPDSITVGDYTGADISFESLSSSTQSMSIDRNKYFAFLVDDVDQAQANVNLMQAYMQEASFSLADEFDEHILGHYTDANSDNVIDDVDLTASNIYTNTLTAKKNLSLRNVPSQNRWIVFSPEEIALLEDSDEFTSASNLGDEIKRTGFAGRIAGLEVFESNNLAEAGSLRYIPYGYTGAITAAQQIMKTEAGRSEKKFSDFVKGLHVYGTKTVRPKGLGRIEAIKAS
jgi:hypothetical protein